MRWIFIIGIIVTILMPVIGVLISEVLSPQFGYYFPIVRAYGWLMILGPFLLTPFLVGGMLFGSSKENWSVVRKLIVLTVLFIVGWLIAFTIAPLSA